jgi:hypothetical protein
MQICAKAECRKRLSESAYRRIWCSLECYREATERFDAALVRMREVRSRTGPAPRRDPNDEPDGQPVGWRW